MSIEAGDAVWKISGDIEDLKSALSEALSSVEQTTSEAAGAATVAIAGDTAKLDESLGSVASDVSSTVEEATDKAVVEVIAETDKLDEALTDVSSEVTEAVDKATEEAVVEVTADGDEAKDDAKTIVDAVETATEQADATIPVDAETAKAEQSLDEVARAAHEAAQDAQDEFPVKADVDGKPAEEALDKVAKKAELTAKKIADDMSQIGRGMTVVGAAITAPLALGVKSATDFGSAIASIASLGTQGMGELEATVRKTAVAYGLDLTEAAQGTYDAISSGADAFTAPKILEDAARAAAAGQTDLATSIQFGMGMANAFGVELGDLGGVFDAAFIGVNKGVMTFEELSEAAGRSAPAFAANKIPMDEMVGAAAALTLGNVKASEAFTKLNAVVDGFTRQGESAKLETLGFQGALQWLQEQTGGNKTAMQEFLGSSEALSAALALTGNQSGAFTEIMGEMGDKTGATKEAFDIIAASDPSFMWKQLQASMQDLAITIGQAVMPVLENIVSAVGPWIQSLAEWMKANEGLATTIVLVAGAVGAFMITLGPLFMALPEIIAFFSALGTIGTIVAGVLSGPVVLAIAAVIATGALIYAFWDEIKAAAQSLWDGVCAAFEAGVAFVGAIWDGMVAGGKAVWDAYVAVFQAGADLLGAVWDGIVSVFKWAGEGIIGVFTWIGDTAQGIFKGLSDFFTDIWGGIIGVFQEAWDIISGTVGWIIEGIGAAINAVGEFFGLTGNTAPPVSPPIPEQRAAGGPVSAGQGYLVGEEGPEWFQPNTSGRIIPAGATAAMAGVGGISINISGVTVGNDYDVDRLAEQLGRRLRSKMVGLGIATSRGRV